jgi:ATP-binding cassette subfamily B (MDR/TAP) protein 1
MSSLISQVFSSIRIVQTFTMEASMLKHLEATFLHRLESLGKTRAVARAVEQAGVFFAVFVTHSLAFWIIGLEVVKGADLGYAMTVRRLMRGSD